MTFLGGIGPRGLPDRTNSIESHCRLLRRQSGRRLHRRACCRAHSKNESAFSECAANVTFTPQPHGQYSTWRASLTHSARTVIPLRTPIRR